MRYAAKMSENNVTLGRHDMEIPATSGFLPQGNIGIGWCLNNFCTNGQVVGDLGLYGAQVTLL